MRRQRTRPLTKDEQDLRQTALYLGRVKPTDPFEAFVQERGRIAREAALRAGQRWPDQKGGSE